MHGRPLFRILALAILATAFFSSTRSAFADKLESIPAPNPYVVGSSAGSAPYILTISNPNGYAVDITSITIAVKTGNNDGNGDPGNAGDIVSSVVPVGGSCDPGGSYVTDGDGSFVPNGTYGNIPGDKKGEQSCTLDLQLSVFGIPPVKGKGVAGANKDYGDNLIKIDVGWLNAKNLDVAGVDPDLNIKFVTEVNYDGPASTPEPSSLLLLGTGMLGLAGMVRRRLGRG